jgi:hypothetical protein
MYAANAANDLPDHAFRWPTRSRGPERTLEGQPEQPVIVAADVTAASDVQRPRTWAIPDRSDVRAGGEAPTFR